MLRGGCGCGHTRVWGVFGEEEWREGVRGDAEHDKCMELQWRGGSYEEKIDRGMCVRAGRGVWQCVECI